MQRMMQRSDDEELGDVAFSSDGEYMGPQIYEDIHMWPSRFEKIVTCQYLASGTPQPGRPLVVTTHFSGVGTAEIACAMVAESLKVKSKDIQQCRY